MVVNACPAATTSASPDRVWSVFTTLERFEDSQDARFVSPDPSGPVKPGQFVQLSDSGKGPKSRRVT